MTVNEFIAHLNELGVSGDETLIVSCFGGLSCNKNPVAKVSRGFDWNSGCVVLQPEHAVAYYRAEPKRTSPSA